MVKPFNCFIPLNSLFPSVPFSPTHTQRETQDLLLVYACGFCCSFPAASKCCRNDTPFSWNSTNDVFELDNCTFCVRTTMVFFLPQMYTKSSYWLSLYLCDALKSSKNRKFTWNIAFICILCRSDDMRREYNRFTYGTWNLFPRKIHNLNMVFISHLLYSLSHSPISDDTFTTTAFFKMRYVRMISLNLLQFYPKWWTIQCE